MREDYDVDYNNIKNNKNTENNNNINSNNLQEPTNDNSPIRRKSKLHERLGIMQNNQNILNIKSDEEKNLFDDDDDEEGSSVNFDLGKNIYRYNILLVGDCSVGKTSIINRFIDNRFNRNLKNTINIEFRIKSIKLDSNTVVDLKIWDTCGEEKFHSITKNFYHEADGIFIIFDLGNYQSFSNIKIFMKDINDVCNINNKAIMIIGNKNDITIEEQKVKDKEIKKILEKNREIKYLDVSARSGNNIGDMFIQMSKLIFLNKNKIIENEDEDKDNSSEYILKIGKYSRKNSKKSVKSIEQERKDKCC